MQDQNLQAYQTRVREVLVDAIRKQAIAEKAEARNRLNAECLRLGSVAFERSVCLCVVHVHVRARAYFI